MNNNTRQKRRPRRSPEQWVAFVEEWRTSGLSAQDYAEQHDLGVDSLWRWAGRQTKATGSPSEPEGLRPTAPRFLAVEVAQPARPPQRESDSQGTIEVAWPGGAVVRLSGEVDRTTLVAVMQTLAEVTPC